MNPEQKSMLELFQTVTGSPFGSLAEGPSLYQKQIQNRLLTIPAQAFLKPVQNIWGRDFVQTLLAQFFAKWPPEAPRWDVALRELPEFILEHPDYQRVIALYDMAALALKIWNCIHGPDETREQQTKLPRLDQWGLSSSCCFHQPMDRINLFLLWQRSEKPVQQDPAVFWPQIQDEVGVGCIFLKASGAYQHSLPLPAPMVPLLQQLGKASHLYEALNALTLDEAARMRGNLAESISLWQQVGLLIAR